MLHSRYNYSHDSTARANAGQASRQARQAVSKIDELESEIERLNIICEALWNLLQKHAPVKEIDLIEQVTEIDLSSGRLDGRKARSAPRPCGKCQRPVARRRPFCLYCGEPVLTNPFA